MSKQHIKTALANCSTQVQWYFSHVESLIKDYPPSIALIYMFSRVEEAQNMTIYMAMRKLHKVDKNLAQEAIDRHEMRRHHFRGFFEAILGKKLPQSLQEHISSAEDVRDRLIHGKSVSDADAREAIRNILKYAEGFNELTYPTLDVCPFGPRTGFTGASQPLNRKTSGWVIKGMGL